MSDHRMKTSGRLGWMAAAALLGALGCEAGDTGVVIAPDAGDGVDGGTDLGGPDDTPDVPATPIDRPDVPAPTDVASDVPDAVDAVDVPTPMDVARDAPEDGCRSSDDCPAAQHCDPVTLVCVAGCHADEACRAAADGGAVALRCDPAAHECVQCLADGDCPSGRLCTGGACVAGCSASRACPSGETCCGGACVDLMANPVSCGVCDNRCGLPNAVAFCRSGACAVSTCAGGFADCDLAPANGCEVNAQTDLANCGACRTVCPTGAHVAARTCVVGRCGITCDVGFADCDGDPADGCEVDLVTTATRCGACGTVCPARPHAAPACVSRSCALRCDADYGDCDGDAGNGCETDTRASVAHCGACGRACSAPHATTACGGSMCAVAACEAGYGNCNGAYADGCEAALDTPSNCGACGRTVAEVCDGADNDCDGAVDEGCPTGVGAPVDQFTSIQFGGGGGGSFADVCPSGVAVGFDGRAASRVDQLSMRCMRLALTEDRSVTPFRYFVRPAGATTSPGVRGGSGGDAFSSACDAGSFVSSIRGRSGSRVDQFGYGCGYWQLVGSPTTGWRLDLVATAARGTWGGTGGNPFAYECPDAPSGQHTAVTSLLGRSASEVDAVAVRCGLPDVTVR